MTLRGAVAVLGMVALVLSGCASSGVTAKQESLSHYRLGLSRMQAGNDEAGLYEFNLAIQKDPSNKDAQFLAGIIYYRQHDYERAMEKFRKTISIDPRYSDAYNNLALCYVQSKQYDMAIENFRAAMNEPLSNSRTNAMMNLGMLYNQLGDHDKSAQMFREILLIMPSNAAAMLELARQYEKLGNNDESERYYNKVIELYPDSVEMHYELGMFYYKTGRNELAAEQFDKVIELAPGSELAGKSDEYLKLIR